MELLIPAVFCVLSYMDMVNTYDRMRLGFPERNPLLSWAGSAENVVLVNFVITVLVVLFAPLPVVVVATLLRLVAIWISR